TCCGNTPGTIPRRRSRRSPLATSTPIPVLSGAHFQPVNQRAELLATQTYLSVFTYGPGELSLFQSLGTDPQPGSVPPENLEPVPSPVGEEKEIARQWIPFPGNHRLKQRCRSG